MINNVIDTNSLRSEKTESVVARFLPKGEKRSRPVTELSPQHEHLVHVHFSTGNEEIIVALPYSDQTMRLMDLVPIAQTHCDAIVEMRIRQSKSDGRAVVCRQCLEPVCCQSLVGISTIEAAYLAKKLVDSPSPEAPYQVDQCRKRALQLDRMMGHSVQIDPGSANHFAESVSQLQNSYASSQLDCVFLRDGRCEIYRDRPLTCRHWLVSGSQTHCRTTGVARQHSVDMPVNLNDALIETAFRLLGRYEIVTLPAMIDWYERHNKLHKQGYASEDLVWTFLESLKDSVQHKAERHMTIRLEQIR